MTDNTRFQPGDKVRVKPALAHFDLGLSANVTYTVSHVDDFGGVALRGNTALYYHPSHFELVMRALGRYGVDTDMPCYSLKDGEGDWWVFNIEAALWTCETHSGGLPRAEFEEGIELIEDAFGGIDAEPTAPAETYCLKDGDGGDWWVFDAEADRWEIHTQDTPWYAARAGFEVGIEHLTNVFDLDTASTSDTALAELRERLNGPAGTGNSTGPSLHFEAVPLQPGDRAKIVRTSATEASHGIADGMRGVGDEFTVTEVGTNSHGPFAKGDAVYDWHPEDLEKVGDSTAPLKAGDAVLVWAEVDADLGDELRVRVRHAARGGFTAALATPDTIVRPADGQTPPWEVEAQEAESEAISNITATLRREGGMDYDAAHEVAASLFRAGVTVKETN